MVMGQIEDIEKNPFIRIDILPPEISIYVAIVFVNKAMLFY